MTFFNDTQVNTATAPSRSAAFFAAVALKLRQRKAYNRAMNELCTMTQREMADLGLSRGDFRRLAREAAELVK